MLRHFLRQKKHENEIYPDEIFLDARNLPQFNVTQMEGRLERSIAKRTILLVAIGCALLTALFFWRIGTLQIVQGKELRATAENNRLQHIPLFAERGVVTDRFGTLLAWNVPRQDESFANREYIDAPGFGHVLGYVQYPARDKAGYFYRDEYIGKGGVEEALDDILSGKPGLKIIETDARGDVQSEGVTRQPEDGVNVMLAIDTDLQQEFFSRVQSLANDTGFQGGAAALMDIYSGELLALTSFPEYRSSVMANGEDNARIQSYVSNPRKPFLNRAVAGVYQPGSIVKPFVGAGVLEEEIIEPDKKIESTGSISIPNPYYPDLVSVFNDWKAHGWVDMRDALAVSSNVYFYEVGGGYEEQEGLGIDGIEKYMRAFGLGEKTGITLPGESEGLIPTPEWKHDVFEDEWRIGDTYHTAIGQYGFQITVLQAVRAAAAIANDGYVLTPKIEHARFTDIAPSLGTTTPVYRNSTLAPTRVTGEIAKRVPVSPNNLAVIREGMRRAVTDGTAKGLLIPSVRVAAKTGTAEVGISKKRVNSWVIGFFPYEKPRYAFAVVMERGPRENTIGGLFIMRRVIEWMQENAPHYFSGKE